jgi:hypothetical protein
MNCLQVRLSLNSCRNIVVKGCKIIAILYLTILNVPWGKFELTRTQSRLEGPGFLVMNHVDWIRAVSGMSNYCFWGLMSLQPAMMLLASGFE